MTDLEKHVNQPGRAKLVKKVREKINELGITYIYYQFISVTGRVVGKGIPADHWERTAEKGFQLVYGATANLFLDRHNNYIGYGPEAMELVGIPDPETFVQLPWDKRVGRVFVTCFRNREERKNPGGHLTSDCRGNLRIFMDEFKKKHGLELRVGTEPEMMWLTKNEDGTPTGKGFSKPFCYHIDQFESLRPVFMKVIEYAKAMGLDMIQGDHEDAPGQLELNWTYDNVLRNADRLSTYRQICAQVAREHNLIACFMTKPFMGVSASGCHTNMSLWKGGKIKLNKLGNKTLPENIVEAIQKENIYAVSVLSGNRNFEGRISPHIKANYLASPPLVVAYAIAGHMEVDLYKDPLGKDKEGKDVFLKDIWPSNKEIEEILKDSLNADMFIQRYSNVSEGPTQWQKIKTDKSSIYNWDQGSTYVKKPPFFDSLPDKPEGFKEIKDARPLLILGDMVTTDHISPAGSIQKDSPTGEYFMEHQILPKDYNSYGSRRGNHEVMMRGTFANIRIRNEMAPGTEGGFTKLYPEEKVLPVYDAVVEYKKRGTDLVVIGGKEYGTGSSRDWAAKGTKLLGIKAVIAESFERIHRSNLIGMGILPLQFINDVNRKNLKFIGSELISILNIEKGINPSDEVTVEIKYASGDIKKIKTLCRIDTKNELEYYKNGGILQYVLRNMI